MYEPYSQKDKEGETNKQFLDFYSDLHSILLNNKINATKYEVFNKSFPQSYGENNKIYTPEIYDRHGIGILISILDYEELNPYSVIFNGPFKTVCELRKFVANKLIQDEDRFKNNILLKDLAKEISFQKKFTPLYERFMINKSVRYNSKISLQDRRANKKKPTSHLNLGILDLRNYSNMLNNNSNNPGSLHKPINSNTEDIDKLDIFNGFYEKRNKNKLQTINIKINSIKNGINSSGTTSNSINSVLENQNTIKQDTSRNYEVKLPSINNINNTQKMRNKSGINLKTKEKDLNQITNTNINTNSNVLPNSSQNTLKHIKPNKENEEVSKKISDNYKLNKLYQEVINLGKNNTFTTNENLIFATSKNIALKGDSKINTKFISSEDITKKFVFNKKTKKNLNNFSNNEVINNLPYKDYKSKSVSRKL